MNLEDKVVSLKKSKDEIFSSFYIGLMEVAINVKSINEVVNFPEIIIKMPLAPDFLLGVFNLRGLIIPIINLKSLLKFEDSAISVSQKIAIIDYEGAKVGLIFDSTNEIMRVNEKDLCDFSYANENSHKVISGAIKLNFGTRILQIINPFALISIENIPQIIEQQNRNGIIGFRSNYKNEVRKKCISFSVNELKMGFDISGIHEIIKISTIEESSVRNTICKGTVNLRGNTVPVIDLALLLKMPSCVDQKIEDKRIIVLKIGNELFGLLVDAVVSINTYTDEDLMPIPLLNNSRTKMFLGCISFKDNFDIILLNYNEVLNNSEVLEITQGHNKMYSSNIQSLENKARGKIKKEAYVSFKLGHLFGVSITDIREIINYPKSEEIISAPGMPSFVKGVLNLRGKLVTIIETRVLYKMSEENAKGESSKILIFDSEEERFGLIVDSIESILTVDEDKKIKVPSLMVQKVQDQFEKDIKEIILFKQGENKECALIILNMEPVTSRVRQSIAA